MRRILSGLTILGLMLLLTFPVLAQGKGNGGGKGGGGNDGGGGDSGEPAVTYQITFLGDPLGVGADGDYQVWGMNSFGESVGRAVYADGAIRATYYSLSTGVIDLTATAGFAAWPNWTSLAATGINEVGQVAVVMEELATGEIGIFRYSMVTDTLELLVAGASRQPAAINNWGDVVFSGPSPDQYNTGYWSLYSESASQVVELQDANGNLFRGVPIAINDSMQICGSQNGYAIVLDAAVGLVNVVDTGSAAAINQAGDVAFTMDLTKGGGRPKRKPAVYEAASGQVTVLRDLGFARDINDSGDVLAVGGNSVGLYVFPAEGGTLNLDTEITGAAADVAMWQGYVSFRNAYMSDRNGAGFPLIIAQGSGSNELFILTPVSQ